MPTYHKRKYIHKPKKQLHSLSGIEVDYYDLRTKRYLWPPGINALGRQILFTGPDGTRDHRIKVIEDPTCIGIGDLSPEATASLAYLYRPDWKNPPPLYRKHERVGGVGWGVPKYSDPHPPLTGHQTRRGEIRRMAEDKYTHRYMCPWYPIPDLMKRPQTCPAAYAKIQPPSEHSNASSLNKYLLQPPSASKRPQTQEMRRSYTHTYAY